MTNTDDLEAKLKAAQAALNAKTMTNKDRRLRGIISRIGNP